MIPPVAQWAVGFKMQLHKRAMGTPGELRSRGLPAPSGMHYLGVLSHFSQSARNFKADLKLSFIFVVVERVNLHFMNMPTPPSKVNALPFWMQLLSLQCSIRKTIYRRMSECAPVGCFLESDPPCWAGSGKGLKLVSSLYSPITLLSCMDEYGGRIATTTAVL